MKKIILIFLLLVSCEVFSQGSLYLGNRKVITDSSNILSMKDIVKMTQPTTYFGSDGDVIFHLDLYNDAGKFTIERFNGDDLLVWDDDIDTWDFKFPITLNGVPITTGGGDAYLGLRNTFTKRNIFDSLSVTKIVSDIPFYKAANTWIWTKDNFPLFLGANNDTAIGIETDNDIVIYEDMQIDGQLNVGELNASTLTNLGGITSLGDLILNGQLDLSLATITGDDEARVQLGLDKVTSFSDADDPFSISGTDKTVRLSAISTSINVYLPPANSVNAGYEIILEDGTGQLNSTTRVLTVHRSGTDLINADSLITMTAPYTFRRFISNGSNRWNYDGGIVRINEAQTLTNKTLTSPTLTTPSLGVATATSINKVAITAPATSATLTIANGKTLTVNNSITLTGTDGTTMTMPNSNSTLAGLENTNNWTGTTNTFADIVGNYVKTDNTYVATKIVQSYISATGNLTIAHGLGGAKWKDITNLSMVVVHDSTGLGNYRVFNAGYNGNTPNNTGLIYYADSLNINYTVPATSTGLIGDTVKITIQYHK